MEGNGAATTEINDPRLAVDLRYVFELPIGVREDQIEGFRQFLVDELSGKDTIYLPSGVVLHDLGTVMSYGQRDLPMLEKMDEATRQVADAFEHLGSTTAGSLRTFGILSFVALAISLSSLIIVILNR